MIRGGGVLFRGNKERKYGFVADTDTTVTKVTENADANVFTVLYKKLYAYEIHYVDDDNNVLESVINQTTLNQVEVPVKQFDGKELVLIEDETTDTTIRYLPSIKNLKQIYSR